MCRSLHVIACICVARTLFISVRVCASPPSYQYVYVPRSLSISARMCVALYLSVRVRVSLSSYQCVHVCHSLPISACMCAALSISRNTCGRTCKRSHSFALLLVQTPSVSSSPHIPHPNLPLPALDSFPATLLPLHPSFSIRTCTHTHVHTYTHVRTHANLNFTILHCPLFAIALPVSRHGPSEKRTHEHTHTYTYTHTHALTYTPTHIYTCTHMHVSTCIHVHAYR